ncbi:DUF1631 domain-containing protein [Methylocaldum sp.]|uniref:DUF1631 domain-containing protein n=1 Tax=Methylocaldum sp. TaxID=1969727 RepID=UPI002D571246|nr:DUF1631 domain-containing protein [Methylocaldum sp.]HYE36189.1 DUF1631 domain-containing protein [Methylocaldum sp.]
MDLPQSNTPVASETRQEILPRYRDLLGSIQEEVVGQFGDLFKQMFEQMDGFMLNLAENADTNAMRSHVFEVMHEILLRQTHIQQSFMGELNRGFDNFAQGKTEPLRTSTPPRSGKLSLIGKDDYDVALAYSEAVRKANENYAPQLFSLNHRLAIINGGIKLGEFHPALPGSPAQVCDAIQTALEALDLPVDHKVRIALAEEFDRLVTRRAENIYVRFNDSLIAGGVLPNLSLEAIGYKPSEQTTPRPAPTPSPAAVTPASETAQRDETRVVEPDDGADATLEHEIFRSIQEILARRHQGEMPQPTRHIVSSPTNFASLMTSLKTLQMSAPPITQLQLAQIPLESIKESFSAQLAQLAEIVQQQQVNSAEADVIDLVGMLFEYILNDNSLPDSVKALLSHLHTPYLKVAILDKKFFFRSKHPARRLLNAMAQAGAWCNVEDNNGQGVFTKMRSIVDRIIQEFDDNTQLFAELLDEFTAFLDTFNQRSKVMEKRAVESAKGRDRLREARQIVSQEIVDRTWDRSLPKAAEDLIMGTWANVLVLTWLRNGKDSEEWKNALAVVDDIISSVTPKSTPDEQQKLRAKIPQLEESIRSGLAMIGDPDVNASRLIEDLRVCYHDLQRGSADATGAAQPAEDKREIRPAPPEVQADKALWDDVEVPAATELPLLKNSSPELAEIVSQLKAAKLGTWFEFTHPEKRTRQRGKLSWFSPKTSYYIFVDQAGIQVAVKSLRILAKEIAKGETRILPIARKPFIDRALETVYSLLKQSDEPA